MYVILIIFYADNMKFIQMYNIKPCIETLIDECMRLIFTERLLKLAELTRHSIK